MRPRLPLTTRAVLAAALVPLLAPGSVAAQGGRWERQVRDGLRQVTSSFANRGYTQTGDPHFAPLNTREAASFTLTLMAGTSYVLAGVCDEDCDQLDLVLYSGVGYEVDAARASGGAPIARVTPTQTMPYRVKILMANCRKNPCWSGVGVFRK